ncbi:hypothetical protein B2G71_12830 [Novosphingobium sp. PC22D]|uniref:hypothetical protein n=1 Tax=Novosphingobium sp. PC22D TaxID=1962403 RepID=UPI000BFABB8D|nr:hypothetical protein [Novosphingobium sp. PC22D]PEQ12371.1 hypothetical protein B2G71_12830 [Novosphingobium sp. PC22D]
MKYRSVFGPMALAALPACLLALAGCKGEPDDPMVEPMPTETAVPLPEPTATGTGSVSAVADGLDVAALKERRDPERLLRFYTNALRLGDWQAAARAWSLDAQMTPEKLESEFGGQAGPKVAVGKGDVEGAAGSLFYEAPVVIDFADGRPSRRGTIVLRRVNDVPGATEEQLNWRIERSSTLPQ